MENFDHLPKLEERVEELIHEELRKQQITYEEVKALVYPYRTVGVQGDDRSYAHPVEIAIYNRGELIYDTELLDRLSTTITNNIRDINRVAVLLKEKKE